MQGFCSHLTGMVVAARFLWRNEADLHISDRFVPYFGAGRKTIRTVAEINNQERELGPPEMEVSIQECQGGKTFCASFCAFLIAGSRQPFSVCWLCLFVAGVLSEMHKVRTFAPCKAFLFDMFAFFSSLENYFGFRTTNVKGKTDHSVSLRWNKRFWTFLKRRVFFLIVHPINLWVHFAELN